MGRFGEALAAVPEPDTAGDARLQAEAHCLRACALWITDDPDAACAAMQRVDYADVLDGRQARAVWHYLTDGADPDPTAVREYRRASEGLGGTHEAWARLLADWCVPVAPAALPPVHAALAWQRRHAPAEAARGEAVFAEARFRQAPGPALVWLDHALERLEQFGQHHLKARLLHRKALSLEAAGLLAEADRFLAVARETALRQGAWRYLRAMAL